MAFRVGPTLSEVRTAVAVRLNLGVQAAQAPARRNLLDEFIRAAFHDILETAYHLVLHVRLSTDLVDMEHSYDTPDNMNPGDIGAVYVLDTEGNEYPLSQGLQSSERTLWKEPPTAQQALGKTNKGLPQRWEIVDQNFDIYPAPDTEKYPTLVIEGKRLPPEPQNSDDRIDLDKEALIRLATYYGKLHFKHPDADDMKARYDVRERDLRANDTEGEGIRIGGHWSNKFRYTTRRTLGTDYDRSRYPFWYPP